MPPRDVTIPAPGGSLPALLCEPADRGPWPGVVVLHDLVGMSSDLRDQAAWLAAEGYLTVAPNLYRGDRGPRCLVRMIRDTWRREGPTFEDIDAVRGWLSGQPICTGQVGVIGFCLGGGFALLMAADHRFDVASANYGPVSTKVYTQETFARSCPIVGSYGGKDPGNRGVGEKLERILTAVRVPHDIKTYPEAGHAFLNDHVRTELPSLIALQFRLTGNPYGEAATVDARRRILAFFAAHLG